MEPLLVVAIALCLLAVGMALSQPAGAPRLNPHRVGRALHDIKCIAFDIGITVVFLFWVAHEILHQLGLR